MTGAPAPAGRGCAAAEPRGLPALEPDEALWLKDYLDRLKKVPGGLIKRLVVYGSKARGDAGPASDVDILVLVGDAPDAVLTARGLSYTADDPDTVDHSVVVRTEADWLRDGAVPEERRGRGNPEPSGPPAGAEAAGVPSAGDPEGRPARRARLAEGGPVESQGA